MNLEALLTTEEDGEYEFGLSVCGTAKLLIDGNCIIDNSTNQIPGGTFLGAGTREEVGPMKLQAGKTYKIMLHFGSAFTSSMKVPGVPPMHGGGFRLGGVRKMDPTVEIEKAVQLAKEFDQAVIIAGLNVSLLHPPPSNLECLINDCLPS
jgi:beta-glucosidase